MSETQSPTWTPVAALGIAALLAVVCAGGAGGAWLYAGKLRSDARERTEVASNVDAIRTAQLAYDAAFDEFLASPQWPRPVGAADRSAVPWAPAPMPWNMLGWAPDGQVRGTYSVEVTRGGADFTVHGWADLDQDGVPAHYTATKSINTTQVTPDRVR